MNAPITKFPGLVLASSSPYRKKLLQNIGLRFATVSPSIDERQKPDEKPEDFAMRLAQEKAAAVAQQFPEDLIIGSDQVAMLAGQQLTKPGGRANAIRQLRAASGQAVTFYTSVCVLNSATNESGTDLDRTIVHFRPLTNAQIEAYVDRDQPFDCAGGFKSESLGVVLFEKIEGEDPNALIGLPMIRLIRLLETFGVTVI